MRVESGNTTEEKELRSLDILPPSEHTSWQNCLFNFHKTCKRQPLVESSQASSIIDLAQSLSSFDARQLNHHRLLQSTKTNTHRWQRIVPYHYRLQSKQDRPLPHAIVSSKEIAQDPIVDLKRLRSLQNLKPQISVFGHQFVETTKARKELAGKPAPITQVLNLIPRSPLAPFFVTAGADGFVKIWDTHTARLAFSLRRHFTAVTALSFLNTRNILVSGDAIGHVRFWKIGCNWWQPLGYVETCNGSGEGVGCEAVLNLTTAKRGEVEDGLVLAVTGRGNVSIIDVDKIEASCRALTEGGWGAPPGSLCEAAEILRTECRMDDRYTVKAAAVHTDGFEARVTLSKTRNLAVQEARPTNPSASRRSRQSPSATFDETESESLLRGSKRIPPILARGVEVTYPDLELLGTKTKGKPRLTTNLSLQSYTWPDDLSAVSLVFKLDTSGDPERHGFRVLSDFNPSSAPSFLALPPKPEAVPMESESTTSQAVLCVSDDGRYSRWDVDKTTGRFRFGTEYQSPLRAILASQPRPPPPATLKKNSAPPKPRSPSPCTFLSPDIVRSLGSKVINKDTETPHQPNARSPGVVFVHPITLGIRHGTFWLAESATSDGRRPKEVLKSSMKETGIALLNYDTGQVLGTALYGRHLKHAIVFLCPHPHLFSVCLVATYGGQLMVVDILEGSIVYLHVSEGTTFLAAAWHPNGLEFVVTNANGCLTIFNPFTGDPSTSRMIPVTINGAGTETSYVFPDSCRFRYTPLIQFLSCDRNPLVEASLRSIFATDEPMSPQLQLAVSLVEDLTGVRRFSGWLFDIHFARMPHQIKMDAKLVDHSNETLLPGGSLYPAELQSQMMPGKATENTQKQFDLLKSIILEQRRESDRYLVSADGCTLRICCPIPKYQPVTYPEFISARHGGPGITYPNAERLVLDVTEDESQMSSSQLIPLSHADSAEEPDWEQEDDDDDSEEDSLEDDPTLTAPVLPSAVPRRRPPVSSPSMSEDEEDDPSSIDSPASEPASVAEIRSGEDVVQAVTREMAESPKPDFSKTPFTYYLNDRRRTDLVQETIQTTLLRYFFLLTLADPKRTGFSNENILDLLPEWVFSDGEKLEAIAEHLYRDLTASGQLPECDGICVSDIEQVLQALQRDELSAKLDCPIVIPKTAVCVLCVDGSQMGMGVRREQERLRRNLNRHLETFVAQWQNRSSLLRDASQKAASLSSRRRLRSSLSAGVLAEVPLFIQLVEKLATLTRSSPSSDFFFELSSPAKLLGPFSIDDGHDQTMSYVHRGCLRSLFPRRPAIFSSGPSCAITGADIRSLVQFRQSQARRRRRPSVSSPSAFYRCVVCEQQGAHLKCLICEEAHHHSCALKRASADPPMDPIPPAYILSPRAFIALTGSLICAGCVNEHWWPLFLHGGNLVDSSTPPSIESDFFSPQIGDAISLLDPGPQRCILSGQLTEYPANALVVGKSAEFAAYTFKDDECVLEVLQDVSLPDVAVSGRDAEESVSDRQRLMDGLKLEDVAKLCEAEVEMQYLVILLPPHRKAGQLVLLNSADMPIHPVIISTLSSSPALSPENIQRRQWHRHGPQLSLPTNFTQMATDDQKRALLTAYGDDPPDGKSLTFPESTSTPSLYPDLSDLDAQLTMYARFVTRQAAGQPERLVSLGGEASTKPSCLSGMMSPLDQLIGIRLIGQALVCPGDWPDLVKRLQKEVKEATQMTELEFWQLQETPSLLPPLLAPIVSELQSGPTKFAIFQDSARLPGVNVLSRLPANPQYTRLEARLKPLPEGDSLQAWEPAYAVETPVFVSLVSIFRRLWTGFYRSFEAFATDLELLVLNSINFNGDRAQFTQDAALLRDSVLEGYKSCEDLQAAHRCPFPHETRSLAQSCRNPQVLASLFLETLLSSRGFLTKDQVAHLRQETLRVTDKLADLTSGQEDGPLPARRPRRPLVHSPPRRRPSSASSDSERMVPKKRRRSTRLVS